MSIATTIFGSGAKKTIKPSTTIKRRRKPSLVPLEEVEQINLVKWLKLKRVLFHSVPNGNSMSSLNRNTARIVGAKLKREGMVSGVSDMVVFGKNKILYIEMKRKKKSLSTVAKNQTEWKNKVNEYPYAEAYICYGWVEAKEVIERCL